MFKREVSTVHISQDNRTDKCFMKREPRWQDLEQHFGRQLKLGDTYVLVKHAASACLALICET